MMIRRVMYPAVAGLLVLAAACSQNEPLTAPGTGNGLGSADKDGTETLGVPSIAISPGSGFAEGGVGMVGTASGVLTVEVPSGAGIRQVLLYWAGGATVAAGDDNISLDGNAVQGTLIGGPTHFFTSGGVAYNFSAYRADITAMGLVQSGLNSLTVTDFDFDTTGGALDENNGCSIVVITDDGTASELSLRDGLDMAYFGFEPTLDRTVPQTFSVTPALVERAADLLLMVASVGQERPNRVVVTTSAGDQIFDDALGSNDGLTWDSLVLPIVIPAGDTDITVEVVSTATTNPKGASLGWVAAGLALTTAAPVVEDFAGTVFVDADNDGLRGPSEAGIGNVVLDIVAAGGQTSTTETAADGSFVFSGAPGSYTVTLDPNSHSTAFNADLAASFTPTTALSVVVDSATVSVVFGFVPTVEAILADLDSGELSSDGETLRYWRKVFRRAIIAEYREHHGRGHGHHGRHGRHGRGWGHNENFPDAEALRNLLTEVEGLYLSEPYQFAEGHELRDVLRILRRRPRTDEERLFRELLVTELNFVSGLGLVGESDRLGVLISWGESLLEAEPEAKSAEKDRFTDVINAISVFSAINTGGGGGVDE